MVETTTSRKLAAKPKNQNTDCRRKNTPSRRRVKDDGPSKKRNPLGLKKQTIKQGNKTQFPRGQSGNPKGRPKGSKNKITLFIEQLLENELEEITRALIERAKDGHAECLKIVMDRLFPVPRGQAITFEMPPLETAADVVKATGSVLKAVAGGQITPAEGESVTRMIAQHRTALETLELEKRIGALETAAQFSSP